MSEFDDAERRREELRFIRHIPAAEMWSKTSCSILSDGRFYVDVYAVGGKHMDDEAAVEAFARRIEAAMRLAAAPPPPAPN